MASHEIHADAEPITRSLSHTSIPTNGPASLRSLVLKTGKLSLSGGSQTWEVTPKDIATIVGSFEAMRLRGITVPIVWNHSMDARDQTGTLRRLETTDNGQKLYAVFDVPDQAAAAHMLSHNQGMSVRVDESFVDGDGNKYPLALMHVGVVTFPVVKESRIYKLSLIDRPEPEEPKKEGNQKMSLKTLWGVFRHPNGRESYRQLSTGVELADGETVTMDGPDSPNDKPVPTDRVGVTRELLAIIADFIGVDSLKLGEDTTEDNFDERYKTVLSFVKEMAAKAKAANGMVSDPATAEDATVAELSLVDLRRHFNRLRGDMKSIRDEATKNTAHQFERRLLSLAQTGRITGDEFRTIRECSASLAGDSTRLLSLLSPFEGRPEGQAANTNGQGRPAVYGGGVRVPSITNKTAEQMTTKELSQLVNS